ncbi:hypothetical protein ACFSC3_03035 [Sphingomonas floccifaciens]|uniref:Uncharacterized protein n=1 Tax=Sphingomonas floccifaciens TaxID=1844115 RepID=A0ABW4N8V3_9SPHN
MAPSRYRIGDERNGNIALPSQAVRRFWAGFDRLCSTVALSDVDAPGGALPFDFAQGERGELLIRWLTLQTKRAPAQAGAQGDE